MFNKIIFILPSLKTGGGTRVIFELANVLANKVDILILAPNNSIEKNRFYIDNKVETKFVGKYSNNKIIKIYNILKTYIYVNKIAGTCPVIITDPIMSLFYFFIKKKIDLYRFIQADDYRIFEDGALLGRHTMIYQKLCRLSYKAKIKFIFNSEYVYHCFLGVSKRTDVPLQLVHPAINHTVFNDITRLDNREFNIGIVGRKHPWKGFSVFVDLIKRIKMNNNISVYNYFVITHDDLSDFDLTDCKLIHPRDDFDIASIYRKCSVFIVPSWWEGFGLPGLESMACGCVLITTRNGGCFEYADDSNCLFFEKNNVDELMTQIERIYMDEKLRYNISNNAKKKSLSFTWEKSGMQLIKILSNN